MSGKLNMFGILTIMLFIVLLLPSSNTLAAPSTMEIVSVSTDGIPATFLLDLANISDDGRFVAFSGSAENLVDDDTNGNYDIFVHDRYLKVTERVSVATDGTEGNNASRVHFHPPAISGDGRFVVFTSIADNLVAEDTNNQQDLFLRDRQANTTTLISMAADGTQANAYSNSPVITPDGRYVAFVSRASNLVADDNNSKSDVFVRDLHNNTTVRVSVANDGSESTERSGFPSISDDGRFVVFHSGADDLVPGDTNERYDVFMRDLENNTTTRVSLANDGSEADKGALRGKLSGDGQFVVFLSGSDNLVSGNPHGPSNVFVRDLQNHTTEQINVNSDGIPANGGEVSDYVSISKNGRYVVFDNVGRNLIPGGIVGAHVYRRDRWMGTTELVSATVNGIEGNSTSSHPMINADGSTVVFTSKSSNLTPDTLVTFGNPQFYVAGLVDNTAPIATDDIYTVLVDETLNVPAPGVLENDIDAEMNNLLAFIDTHPTKGNLSFNMDGSFTYIPNQGAIGTDSFTYLASDRITNSDAVATVVININLPPNTAPIVIDDTYKVTIGDTLIVNTAGILTNDTDADMDTLTAVLDSDVSQGTLTLNADGSFTYTPNLNAMGTDSFTYFANDGTANSDTPATVTITLDNPAGTPPRLYPADGVTLTNQYDWPNFTFQQMDGVEWYQIWIGAADYSSAALFQWYEAAQICDAGVCIIPTDIWLTNGDYRWWMNYWGPDFPTLDYWNETTFSVDFAAPSGAFTLTNPAAGANITTAPTTIEWARDTDVLWYQVWVGTDNYLTTIFFNWVDATENCDDTTCTLDVSGANFPGGGYEVWAEMWGPNGYVTWPASPSATFTLEPSGSVPAPMDSPGRG